jgi:hypothetical protein
MVLASHTRSGDKVSTGSGSGRVIVVPNLVDRDPVACARATDFISQDSLFLYPPKMCIDNLDVTR